MQSTLSLLFPRESFWRRHCIDVIIRTPKKTFFITANLVPLPSTFFLYPFLPYFFHLSFFFLKLILFSLYLNLLFYPLYFYLLTRESPTSECS